MTLVEDYSSEALAEITSILKERVRRTGSCQVTDRSLRTILEDRFGLSGWQASTVRNFVVQYLVIEGVLTVSHNGSERRGRIYDVNASKL